MTPQELCDKLNEVLDVDHGRNIHLIDVLRLGDCIIGFHLRQPMIVQLPAVGLDLYPLDANFKEKL
jgi:hypothetical protein